MAKKYFFNHRKLLCLACDGLNFNFSLFSYCSYSESETECPACHAENKQIVDTIKSQKKSHDHHDQFHSQLEKADDGFAVVADYFGRGLFRKREDNLSHPSAAMHRHAHQPPSEMALNVGSQKGADSIIDQMSTLNIRPDGERHGSSSRPHSKSPAANRRGISPSTRHESHRVQNVQHVEGGNPFGEDFDNSPKKSPKPSTANPFGEPEDDYDDNLNPFA